MKNTSLPAALAALALTAGFALPAFAQVSRTPWQMHEGQPVIKLDAELPPNGALPENGYIAFQRASIPAEGNGWVPAPNPQTIGFGGSTASRIEAAGGTCRRAVDYTYFQTFVDVPANSRVEEFKIAFQGMDDASRITIFNRDYPDGQVVDGSYVLRSPAGSPAATTDLHALVTSGRNRVVITQVDWCPTGNTLQSAQVQLNGSTVETAPAEPAQAPPAAAARGGHGAAATAGAGSARQLCSPAGGQGFEVEFVNNSSQPVSFHWMDFNCVEGGGPTLAPGQREKGMVGAGHIFLARGQAEQVLEVFTAAQGSPSFVVDDSLIAKVAELGEPYTEGSCSPRTEGRFAVEFVNLMDEPISMQWIGFDCKVNVLRQIPAKGRTTETTFPGHVFRFVDSTGRQLRSLDIATDEPVYYIGEH